MSEASEEIARINQETAMSQLNWGREQDAMNRATLERVLGVTLPIMEEGAENARTDRARYEEIFQPLENNLVEEFQNYDSPERQAANRGKAIADVAASFDASRRNALQRLETYGVDPSMARNQALDVGVRTQEAAAKAAAATASTQRTQDVGRSLRAEAINIGKGMPSNVAQSYNTALGAGQGAVGGSAATTNAGVNANQSAVPYMQGAAQGYGQSANIQNQGYQNQMQGWEGSQNQMTRNLNAGFGLAGMMVADGGAIPGREALPVSREGMMDIPVGDGSGVDDAIPAKLSEGEYVIPADVVRIKGEEFFDKLLEKYHTPAARQPQPPAPAMVQAPPRGAM